MTILKAELADAAHLTLLVNSAYRGETSRKGWTTESHLLDGQRIDEATIAGYFETPNVVILKNINAEGLLTGCVYLEKKADELYLGMLSVSPLLQAKGTGAALIKAAEELAKEWNCAAVMMTVISSRHELISYYERRGFSKTGAIVPFHHDEKFGVPRQPIELAVMKKTII